MYFYLFYFLGTTANKEVLRLLKYYTTVPNLMTTIVKHLQDSQLHQDIRAYLILTLLRFIGKLNTIDDDSTLQKILEDIMVVQPQQH